MKKNFLFLLYFVFICHLFIANTANSQSFIKEISYGNPEAVGAVRFVVDNNDEISFIAGNIPGNSSTLGRRFNLVNLNKDGEFKSAFTFKMDSFLRVTPGQEVTLSAKNNFRLISFATMNENQGGILCADIENNTFWARRTKTHTLKRVSSAFATNQNKAIAVTRPYSDLEVGFENLNGFTGLTEFDLKTGKAGWSYTYHQYSSSNPFGFSEVREIVELPNDDIIMSVYVRDSSDANYQIPSIIKISKEGEILNNVVFDSLFQYSFSNAGIVADSDGNLFVSGHMRNRNSWNNDNRQEGFIAKFDSDFNIIWSKRLHAENFSSLGIPIKLNPNGEVVFAYYTRGEIPIILGRINTDGDLIWHNGYSFYTPQIEVGSDGSFFFLSQRKFLSDNSLVPATIVGKAEPNGEIANCPQFTACLTLYDLDLPYFSTDWFRIPSDTLPELTFSVEPFSGNAEDHCQTPTPPNPYFYFPDTICQNQCYSPDSLNNQIAHAVEWSITGRDTLFEKRDNTFNYCFNQPGTYQIEQEIWLLGCTEFFTRELVVLPDSLGDLLGDDRVVCEDSIITLTPNAIRSLKTFEWSDGSSGPSLTVSQSGTYDVEVSDGFCMQRDELAITFFENLFTGAALELPSDTAVCEEFLPFGLMPKSNFSNEFFINNDTTSRPFFEIKEPGNYQIKTTIGGCDFVENFNLGLTPCEVEVYIPSSFSPNNDGINDLLEPLGNDFVGKQLTIFDRWGGKLFETKNPPFSWDGDRAEEGVYLLTFSYLNLRNNKEELVSGDVLVVR